MGNVYMGHGVALALRTPSFDGGFAFSFLVDFVCAQTL
jgi:hypothetical protein